MITMLTIQGVDVEVEIHGAGTPLLMIHGWGIDRRLMTGCMEPLFDDDAPWQRIYPDLPGRGGTPADPRIDSSDATVRLLVDLMAAVAPGRPFGVVGESYGGYLAVGLLAARPDLLGLALICPVTPPRDTYVPRPTAVEVDCDLLAELEPDARAGFVTYNARQTRDVWERYAVEVVPGAATADAHYLDEVLGPRQALKAESGSTAAPVLVVAGRQDSVVGHSAQWLSTERFPRATFALLDRAGHNAQIEQPDIFGALVREWLERVSLSRA